MFLHRSSRNASNFTVLASLNQRGRGPRQTGPEILFSVKSLAPIVAAERAVESLLPLDGISHILGQQAI